MLTGGGAQEPVLPPIALLIAGHMLAVVQDSTLSQAVASLLLHSHAPRPEEFSPHLSDAHHAAPAPEAGRGWTMDNSGARVEGARDERERDISCRGMVMTVLGGRDDQAILMGLTCMLAVIQSRHVPDR